MTDCIAIVNYYTITDLAWLHHGPVYSRLLFELSKDELVFSPEHFSYPLAPLHSTPHMLAYCQWFKKTRNHPPWFLNTEKYMLVSEISSFFAVSSLQTDNSHMACMFNRWMKQMRQHSRIYNHGVPSEARIHTKQQVTTQHRMKPVPTCVSTILVSYIHTCNTSKWMDASKVAFSLVISFMKDF